MLIAAVATMIGMAGAPAPKVAAKAAASPAKGLYIVSLDRTQGRASFINLATIREAPARTFRFWRLDLMSDDHMAGDVKYRQVWTEIKCADRTIRTLDAMEYAKSGAALNSQSKAGEAKGIVPETWDESLYDAVCAPGAVQKMDPKQAFPDIASTVSFFDDFYARHGNPAGAAEPDTQTDGRPASTPGSAADYTSRGYRDMEDGLDDSALMNFDKAVALGSRESITFLGRAVLRFHKGDLAGARADYDKGIALDPSYGGAYAGRAQVLRELGDFEGAISDASRAIALMPDQAYIYDMRGWAYTDLSRSDLAYADFDKAVAIDPQDAQAWTGRGVASSGLKDYEAALKDYNRALTLEPDADWIYMHRGATYLIIGNYDAAIADLDRAIRLNPNSEEAIALRKVAVDSKAARSAPRDTGKIG